MIIFLKIWFSSTVHLYLLQYSNQLGGWGWGFFFGLTTPIQHFVDPSTFLLPPPSCQKRHCRWDYQPLPLSHIYLQLPNTQPSFLSPHLPLVHQIWDACIIEVGEDQLETLTVAISRQQNRPKCVPLSIDLSLILQVATWKLSNMINVLSPTELMENFFVFFSIFHTLGRTCWNPISHIHFIVHVYIFDIFNFFHCINTILYTYFEGLCFWLKKRIIFFKKHYFVGMHLFNFSKKANNKWIW